MKKDQSRVELQVEREDLRDENQVSNSALLAGVEENERNVHVEEEPSSTRGCKRDEVVKRGTN